MVVLPNMLVPLLPKLEVVPNKLILPLKSKVEKVKDPLTATDRERSKRQ